MDAGMRDKRRREIAHCRRRPVKPQRIHFPADGIGEIIEVEPAKPIELCIEATDAAGTLVPWLTDEWWIRTHSFCKDRIVTVVILPTPRSLLDTVVLYQLEMVRRIAPRWRIIGYAKISDVLEEPNVERWVHTPYDEIRLCEHATAPENGDVLQARNLAARAAAATRSNGQHQALVRLTRMLPYELSKSQSHDDSAIQRPPAPQIAPLNRQLSENVVQST